MIDLEKPVIPFISLVYDEYLDAVQPCTKRSSEIAGVRIGTMKRWLREICNNTDNGLPATTRLRSCPLMGLPMQGAVAILHVLRTNQTAHALQRSLSSSSSSSVTETSKTKRQMRLDLLRSIQEGNLFEVPKIVSGKRRQREEDDKEEEQDE